MKIILFTRRFFFLILCHKLSCCLDGYDTKRDFKKREEKKEPLFPHMHYCSIMGYHSSNGIKSAISSLETAVKNKDILPCILIRERNLELSLEKNIFRVWKTGASSTLLCLQAEGWEGRRSRASDRMGGTWWVSQHWDFGSTINTERAVKHRIIAFR